MVYTELNKLAQKRYQEKHRLRILVRKSKTRHNWINELDEEYIKDIFNKQLGKCALSGIIFDDIYKPSIDRIDSSKGYTKDNVQLLVTEINRMKRNFPESKFIFFCKQIAGNN